MKNILKKMALLAIPVVLWFAFFVAFEPNNYLDVYKRQRLASASAILASLPP